MKKKTSFKDLINRQTPTLVEFSAEWCGPCKAMAPILKNVARKVGDQAHIIKIDVDHNPAIARKFRIMSVPTFMLFKNGKMKWSQPGMQSANALMEVIGKANADEI